MLTIPEVTPTYRERQRDAPKVARIIENIVAQRVGNYFAFFPSHWYQHSPRELITRHYQQTLSRFWSRHPERRERSEEAP